MCVRKSKNIRIFIFYQHITVIFLFKGDTVSMILIDPQTFNLFYG